MYNQLSQELYQIIKLTSDLQGAKLIYNFLKSEASTSERKTMDSAESIASPHLDFFTNIRNLFTRWIIQSDIYIENLSKDNFLRRFLKQRDKIQNELDKQKPNATKLVGFLNELQIHLEALQQYGKPKMKKLEEISEKNENKDTIILEKGKPFDALRQVSEIFQKAESYIKLMDKYTGSKTLDFFVDVPEVPIKILTSQIETKNQIQFKVLYQRLKEEKKGLIEIRRCLPDKFHDRYALTEKEAWIIGPSLKDVGYKNWGTLSLIKDKEQRKKIEKIFDELWSSSTPIES